jgi:uncharacterized protein (TIGR03067 family)
MRPLFTLLLLALPAAAQQPKPASLDGAYTVTEFAREGKAVPDDVKKSVSGVKVGDGKLIVTMGGKEFVSRLKVDAARKPIEIELYPVGEGMDKDRSFKGIAEVKDNTLTITFVEDGERPKAFDTDAKTSTRLVLEKR